MKLAGIDIGTNSTRLLIVEKDEFNFKVLSKKLLTTRLGEGVDKNNYLNENSIKRVISALKKFKKEINKYNIDNMKIVGTSALRDVNNSDELINLAQDKLGFDIDIVSGLEEARLTYKGVKTDLPYNKFMIIDIGGGSTEFIWRQDDFHFKSLNIGAVRMTERYIGDAKGKVYKKECKKIEDKTKQLLERNLKNNMKEIQAVGVGGTITTVGAVDLKLEKYISKKIHHYKIKSEDINEISNKFKNVSYKKKKKISGLQPERADIIIAGTIILQKIMEFFDFKNIMISENDILLGMIAEVVNK